MRRITQGILTAVALLAWMCGLVAAQEGGPAMQPTAGFDGYCRAGDWCPLYVILSNEGADIEGELRVVGKSPVPDVYARQVMLPAHSRKAYFLYISSESPPSRLTVQLRAGDEVLLSKQVEVVWLGKGDQLYGVISSDPSALNFLSDVVPASGKAEVAHLSLETLPPDPLGWEALDVLVLNDVDTATLSGEQRQALETWVAHGGHLIVGGGAGAARTVAGLTNLLPVTVGGTQSVEDLWALAEYLGTSTATGPYAVAVATLQDGEALIEQGDLVLLARHSYGAGTVDFMAFDAGLNPFSRWDDNTRLWKLIVEAKAAGVQRLTVSDQYAAREAINSIPGLELPSMLQILAFMLFYTLLIGPVNYVVLRKLDRRELAWLTIPALIVGFTACAYVTGFQIRGTSAIVHRLAVVHVPEGSKTGRVSQLVGLFSPRRTMYDVRVAGTGVRKIPADYYGGPADQQPLYIVEKAEGLTITNLRVDVGGIQPFITEGYADVPGVEADLRLAGDTAGALRLEGTVRNGNVPLKGVVLTVGGKEQRLGDLEAGAESKVYLLLYSGGGVTTTTPWPPAGPVYNIPNLILGPGNYWQDKALYRRYQFLQAIFPYQGPGLGPGVYLFGWVEEGAPLPVEVVDRPFSKIETTLYIYKLPVTGLEKTRAVTIPPDLINRQVEETKGPVDVWPEGCHMEPGATIVFRFTIWPGMMLQQVDKLLLDLQGSSYGGNASHPPAVSLWNWETEDWERLDVGWGQHSIPDAGAYVLPSGAVLVRLETDTEWPADVNSLNIAIEGKQ